ncbi:Protein of unknown function [Halorubrum xinjiangense]|uniref:DUF262 domain-containing protein n=1 Tax=Halorubrum xinjiangense TaxID=261291 RepID=A0A1G7LWP5_9EURY|nr:DUF262 domain-containing protein [Halorubrum xinjiangense]SDF53988.1 Protein of unknown function [Halorubrum xinjiangense]
MPEISDYIQDINKRIFLPGLQREYVWSEKQTEKLFDSLIRGYPVGQITQWDVAHTDTDYYPYKFIQKYVDDRRAVPESLREKGYRKYNEEASKDQSNLSYLVIDGQQRLTSLFIGLVGQRIRYTKGKGGKRSNIQHWSSRELCVNLLGHPDFNDDQLSGDFEFEFKHTDDFDDKSGFGFTENTKGIERYWFPLPNMMNENREVKSSKELMDITDEELNKANLSEERRRHLKEIRSRVIPEIKSQILNEKIKSEEVKKEASDIKEIFQRINIEGEDPDPHQLLLSRMMSTWPFSEPEDEKINPRELTEKWVPSFQQEYEAYNTKIDRELFMRYSMYIIGKTLKTNPVTELGESELLEIRDKWLRDGPKVSKHESGDGIWFCYGLDAALKSVTKLGFTSGSMSTMAIIAALGKFYYYNPNADPDNEENLRSIYNLLSRLLLLKSSKGSISRVEATRISNFIHENIDKDYTIFPTDEVLDYLMDYVDAEITAEIVENIVEQAEYQNATSSSIFSNWDVAAILDLSTPYAQYTSVDKLEVDHIYPEARASEIANELGVDEEEINIHRIGNLQLLPREKNRQKSDKPPIKWLQNGLGDVEKDEIKRVNNFPDEYPSVENYQEFVEAREKKIIEAVTEEVQS